MSVLSHLLRRNKLGLGSKSEDIKKRITFCFEVIPNLSMFNDHTVSRVQNQVGNKIINVTNYGIGAEPIVSKLVRAEAVIYDASVPSIDEE